MTTDGRSPPGASFVFPGRGPDLRRGAILSAMTHAERTAYLQIHPAQLASDAAGGLGAVAAFAAHRPVLGATLAIVPFAVAAFLSRKADVERAKRTRLGAYARRFLTPSSRVQRLAGFAILCAGAWTGSFLTGVLGAALIVHAWTMGLLIPRDLRK